MDLKVIMATFTAVFFAEMADKTQMVGLGMSSKTQRPWSVLVGSIAAYALITAITVLIGSTLGKYIHPNFIRFGGEAIFIILGILMFTGKM